ncbi:hypothetical protein [Dyella japonica]|uniref:Uncharacterized protein n=1 Tax=Dyella japonica A8 TaxID=1217721 RepID=A0A075K271_9GAMM|nr:hypothetical protein [Dyella japonica]AIF48334.1 hypothetical protein HY57_14310 [Dyella japonica A8]
MSTHDHDNDALPGEDELKALYRSLPRKEPSPELDRTIKRAAADAVRPAHRRSAPRWPFAAASAAMVVVAAGLGWRMMQQPSSVPQVPVASSVSARSAPAAAPVSAMPAAPPSTPALANTTAPITPLAAKSAPQVPALLPSGHENIRSAVKPKVVSPAPAPAPPPAIVEESTGAIPAPQENIATTPATVPAPAPPPPAPPAPPVQAQAAPAVIAAAPYANTADAASAAPAAALPLRQGYRASAMKSMTPAAPMQPAPMPASDATAPNPSDTPAQELDKIRLLFAWHRHDEAMQRLAAFQKAHPDMPLPDDLRAQLPGHE